MEGSSVDTDLGAPPESWEVADLDANVRRLMLTSPKEHSYLSSNNSNNLPEFGESSVSDLVLDTSAMSRSSSGCVSEDLINSVDQFLREALQNPRERVSVLRIEQDVEKFMHDNSRQQMEFKQLPTSYLRLAAHRIAQHYTLSSTVLLENDQPDGTGSRIIVQKTSGSRMPPIRLADIPLNIPPLDDSGGVVKVAIKQRPQKGSQSGSGSNYQLLKSNSLKSVEERKDDYNKARARIFNSNSSNSFAAVGESDRVEERFQQFSRSSSMDNNSTSGGAPPDPLLLTGGLVDASTSSSSSSRRSARSRAEKELVSGGPKVGNKVAIFRDRETERKDPDYDRSYDRYMQRFDPGFGFNRGTYAIQPLYAPAVDYNTEFPQLGSPAQRSPIPNEHHLRPLPHHQSGHWSGPSTPGIVYGHPDTMMSTFSLGHVGTRPNSAMFLASQYPSQHAGVPYMFQQDHLHQYFTQSSQQQHDATYGFARPR